MGRGGGLRVASAINAKSRFFSYILGHFLYFSVLFKVKSHVPLS